MEEFIGLTEPLARVIGEMEKQRKKVGEFLKESNSLTSLELTNEVKEEKIVIPVDSIQLNGKISGVGGSVVKKSFHGIDLMLLRVIAVIFSYKDNNLDKMDYYPEETPSPQPRTVLDIFSNIEFEVNSSIERLIEETTVAKETIEMFEPDFMFLKESIIPHSIYVPEKGSLLYGNYKRMIENYNKLFEALKQRKTILASVTEESRDTRFCEVLDKIFLTHVHPDVPSELKIVLNRTKDSNLLDYVLQKGERSFVFPFSSEPEKQPILKEINEKNKLFSFYLKTVESNRPVKVDFFAEDGLKTVDKISSTLLSCCGQSSHSIPQVIVEAKQRANLEEKDLEMFYLDLIDKTGNISSLFKKRRNQIPF